MRLSAGLAIMLSSLAPAASAHAQTNGGWILIAETDKMKWEGQAGSWRQSNTNSGKLVASATGRSVDLKSKEINFERWYVPIADCRSGSGKVSTTDMAGDFKYDNDFILKGGNVASSIADMLCHFVEVNDAKSLL